VHLQGLHEESCGRCQQLGQVNGMFEIVWNGLGRTHDESFLFFVIVLVEFRRVAKTQIWPAA